MNDTSSTSIDLGTPARGLSFEKFGDLANHSTPPAERACRQVSTDVSTAELVLERIADGRYLVDAEAGTVTGPNGSTGAPCSGGRYLGLTFRHAGRNHHAAVHRIVWISVHGPIPEGFEINHKNTNGHDNRLENLELVTHQENVDHANATLERRPASCEHCGAGFLQAVMGRPRRWCPSCTPAALARAVAGTTSTCGCGASIEQPPTGRRRHYCLECRPRKIR